MGIAVGRTGLKESFAAYLTPLEEKLLHDLKYKVRDYA